MTSVRIIMPLPPPYGLSSTVLCRPRPKWRKSKRLILTFFSFWALPIMLRLKTPLNISGKSVRIQIFIPFSFLNFLKIAVGKHVLFNRPNFEEIFNGFDHFAFFADDFINISFFHRND